jgi:hypothetical protein
LLILKETPCSYRPFEMLNRKPSSTALVLFLSVMMSSGISTSISISNFIFFISTNLTIQSRASLSTLPIYLQSRVDFNTQYPTILLANISHHHIHIMHFPLMFAFLYRSYIPGIVTIYAYPALKQMYI